MFAFGLARLLGCFVEDIMEGMTAKEFAEWHVVLSAKPGELEAPADVEDQLRNVFAAYPQPH